jgi:hypothetical protein
MNSLNRLVVRLEAYRARQPTDLSYLSDQELYLLIAKEKGEPDPTEYAAALMAMTDEQLGAELNRIASEEGT